MHRRPLRGKLWPKSLFFYGGKDQAEGSLSPAPEEGECEAVVEDGPRSLR